MQEINIKAQGNRRKSDMIISLVRHGEEHPSFPFWNKGRRQIGIKEDDRHWNKER